MTRRYYGLLMLVLFMLVLPGLYALSITSDSGRRVQYDYESFFTINCSNTSSMSIPVSVNISGDVRVLDASLESGLFILHFKPWRLGSGLLNTSCIENGTSSVGFYSFQVVREYDTGTVIAFYASIFLLLFVIIGAYYLFGHRDIILDIALFSFIISIISYSLSFASGLANIRFLSDLGMMLLVVGSYGFLLSLVLLIIFLIVWPIALILELVERQRKRGKR